MSSQIEGSKTIVSVTPLAVLADSRTFKEAASMKRFGFNSIVMEGESSQLTLSDLPFELHTMVNPHNQGHHVSPDSLSEQEHSGRKIIGQIKCLLKKVNKRVPLSIREFISFLLFVKVYFLSSVFSPLRFIPRASLYYIHSPVFFPAVYLLSKRYKVPFIYDAHDFYSDIEGSRERSRMEKRWYDPFYRKIEAFCITHSAAVVTVSEGLAKLQENAFGVRSIVIRNCQDLRLEKSPPQHLRQLIGLSSKDFLLVTIGQAKKGMAVREAFEALLQLPPWVHLALVGKNQDQYLEDICKYELENRVHVVQPVKPYEVVSFIRSADLSLILYYPRSNNYEYLLPNGFFQSVAAGLPILYPELSEIKGLAESYKLGIPINPCLPHSISEAVMTLMDNPNLITMYRQNAQRTMQELNWEKEEVILRKLVLNVLESRPNRRVVDKYDQND